MKTSKWTPQWNNNDWNTPMPTTDDQVRIEALEREVAELKGALSTFVEIGAIKEAIPSAPEWRKLLEKLKPKG